MNQTLSQKRILHLKQDYERGFIRHCGFKADQVAHGKFRASLVLKDHHRQQDGFVHAGVMATMADHTAGYAAFTVVDPTFQILSIEFKINFFKPAFGRGLECRSTVIRAGRKVIVAESEVYDLGEENRGMTAKAMVTLMAVPGEALV
ncbi:MAG: PaaI family thioesterase [Desulfobacterium sp.]|nr:PaaI family thioesterase [Desulfobacterium sp.]